MNVSHNPPRRTALIWAGAMLAGLFMIFLPGIIGLAGFDGGFVLSSLGGFIAIISLIALVIYLRIASILDRITKKENLLAYWKYTPEEWKAYTEQEHGEDNKGRRNLFFLIAILSLLVGLVLWLIVREHPVVIILIVLGIIAITGVTAWISGLANYRHNKMNLGEVYIALDGAYLNRQLLIWKGLGDKLEDISFEANSRAQPMIKIEYSSPGPESRDYYTAGIPVPYGQEEQARKLVADIAAVHLKK
jgi:hypothetical protein